MFTEAKRFQKKLKIAVAGPSGSGKTFSALSLATGMGAKRIALLDTENKSSTLYAGDFKFDVGHVEAPHTPEKTIQAIEAMVTAGYDVGIIDSMSASWEGEGGILDQLDKMNSGNESNSFAAWKKLTPRHRRLVEAIIGANIHLIVTIRSKTEYILEKKKNKSGKTVNVPKKVGLAPIQRAGIDYEFDVFFEVDLEHNATPSKHRTGALLDGYVAPLTKKTGKMLYTWATTGDVQAPKVEIAPAVKEAEQAAQPEQAAKPEIAAETNKPTVDELKALFERAAVNHGLTGKDVAKVAKDAFKVTQSKDITRMQYDILWKQFAEPVPETVDA